MNVKQTRVHFGAETGHLWTPPPQPRTTGPHGDPSYTCRTMETQCLGFYGNSNHYLYQCHCSPHTVEERMTHINHIHNILLLCVKLFWFWHFFFYSRCTSSFHARQGWAIWQYKIVLWSDPMWQSASLEITFLYHQLPSFSEWVTGRFNQ